MTKGMANRVRMIKAMEFIARQINDEYILDTWFTCGVPDGGIEHGDLYDDPDGIEFFLEDEHFAELMKTFLDCMEMAKESGGLYCDEILSE